jgi:DNA-binding transcriptional MerR regulator
VAGDGNQQPMSIGEFGRRTLLTPKALRLYDRIGLLRPKTKDPATGYRRYTPDQVRKGQLIGLLRAAGLSLVEIGPILEDADADIGAAVQRLELSCARLDRHISDQKLLIRHAQTTLEQGADPMFTIRTRSVPASRVMSIQRRLHASETDAFVREAKGTFAAHLGATDSTGPFILIFHGIVSDENDGPLEAVLGCPDNIQPTELIGVRTEPAHDEAYTTITKREWAYPAILAAYDAVACSAEARARSGSRLSCREVYVAEPDDVGLDDPVCDVAFPLAEAG